MSTPVFACGFECGVSMNTNLHWGLGAGASFSTTTFRSGLRSLRCNVTLATNGFASHTNAASANFNVARVYVYFASLPTLTSDLCLVTDGGSTLGAYFNAVDSKIYAGTSLIALGATGVSVTTGVWYRLDVLVNTNANPQTVDVSVDGTACGQATVAVAAAAKSIWRVGDALAAATFDMFFDDFWASQSLADYPFGGGYIISYIPNADGTHTNNGANDVERTLTGTDINIATTTTYQLVGARPMESASTDFINIKVAITDYVEIAYEDSVESVAPRSVEAIVGYHDASGAGTHNFVVTLRDSGGGTTADIMAAATRNVGATMSWGRAHFTTIPGGGAWTLAAVNALRSRINASDASPDVYIDGLMLEAEYAPVSANPNSEGESGLHAIGRGAVAAHNPAVRLGGWLEYH